MNEGNRSFDYLSYVRKSDGWVDAMIGIRAVLLVLVLLLSACGTLPPTPTTPSFIELEAEPSFYLIATKQKPEILASLRRAEIAVVDDLLESSHQLRVILGVDKSFRDCGTLNNVKYAIRQQSRTLLELAGRGWTGECSSNVFDEMSRELAQIIRASIKSSDSK